MVSEKNIDQNAIQRSMLVNVRMTAQFTQSHLSQKLGRPQSYVSKYEAGERRLTLVEVREIVICCGLSLPEFIEMFEQEIILSES